MSKRSKAQVLAGVKKRNELSKKRTGKSLMENYREGKVYTTQKSIPRKGKGGNWRSQKRDSKGRWT